MVSRAAEYRWSSAAAHLNGRDDSGLLDMEWWRREGRRDWEQALNTDEAEQVSALRQWTYSGKPFGSETFIQEIGERFGRRWVRGRPREDGTPPGAVATSQDQAELF